MTFVKLTENKFASLQTYIGYYGKEIYENFKNTPFKLTYTKDEILDVINFMDNFGEKSITQDDADKWKKITGVDVQKFVGYINADKKSLRMIIFEKFRVIGTICHNFNIYFEGISITKSDADKLTQLSKF